MVTNPLFIRVFILTYRCFAQIYVMIFQNIIYKINHQKRVCSFSKNIITKKLKDNKTKAIIFLNERKDIKVVKIFWNFHLFYITLLRNEIQKILNDSLHT